MDLIVYPRLRKKSKLAIKRKKWRWGRDYTYKPTPRLINRLSRELAWSADRVQAQIAKEREFLLKYSNYY
jgi:hypothetical protein